MTRADAMRIMRTQCRALKPARTPKVSDEELELENAALERPGASAAIAIPNPGPRALERRTGVAIPINELRSLDRHTWDTESNLLEKWVTGAGAGERSTKLADSFFEPGSPPRRKV